MMKESSLIFGGKGKYYRKEKLEEEQKQLLEIIENTNAYVQPDLKLNLIYGNKALEMAGNRR